MNPLKRNILTSIIGTALAAAPMISLSSCSAFNEELEECPEGARIRVVYKFHLEGGNSVPEQVHNITLFVYDEQGRYLETHTESGEALTDENYRMEIDLPAGKYTLLAYAGVEESRSPYSFHFVDQPGPTVPLQDIQVQLNADCLTRPNGTFLTPLFYGLLEMEVKDDTYDYTDATVRLMKDTNNIRILLQQLNGQPVNDRDFNFRIVNDNNSLFDWQNIPVASATPIDYYPWITGQAVAGENTDGSEAVLAYAEFSTSRLYVDNKPRLVITRNAPGSQLDGETIVDIPLINYLLLLKSQEFSNMSSQDFLDKDSRWHMIFFLDANNYWVRTHIVINDWVVRINDADL